MINRTFINKSTSIIKNSKFNFGLNPICELNRGREIISRALIYFDVQDIKNRIQDKTYADPSKLKHVLKLTNCGSINTDLINKKIPSSDLNGAKERATSFDVILFLIPQEWDEGRGFDYGVDFWMDGKPSYSIHGCNWFQSKDAVKWPEDGVYSNGTLQKEFDKFLQNEDSIIIGCQHFDFGNENFEFDITKTVNKFVNNEIANYGIGIAFSPLLEDTVADYTQYVGFFNEKTNTFFEPYLETLYDEYVNDDRANFYLNKKNRLYLYSYIGGDLENLDNIPICKINEQEYEVKQATKGIYYIEILLKNNDIEPDTILYDNWSNLAYKGQHIDDVEMEFVVLSPNNFFNIGQKSIEPKTYVPFISGINDNEDLIQGENRVVIIDFRKRYTTNERNLVENAEYRIFVKDGKREIDVIKFTPIEKAFLYNYFTINTSEFVPNTYYVDIKVKYGLQTNVYKEKLKFNIISNITNIKK